MADESYPDGLKYHQEHDWAKIDGDTATFGITWFAQDQLGDVVFVGLPDPGTTVAAGQPLGEIESTKSVSDIYSPIDGTVVDKNREVEENPELVNDDPYGRGWLVVIEGDPAALGELLDAGGYEEHTNP